MGASPITAAELAQIPIAFATASLGMHSDHTLEIKLSAMQQAGYKFVELGFGNFMAWVRSRHPDLPPSSCPETYKRDDEPDNSDELIWSAMYHSATELRLLISSMGMKLVVFQPLSQYEGWPEGSSRGAWVREKARRWIILCSRLGVDFLQLGSNDQDDATAPESKILDDLRFLGDLAMNANPPVKVSYEPWSFALRKPDWESCWKVVEELDHPNIGLCMDTAHVALNPTYGYDPLTGEGYDETQFQATLARIRLIPAHKLHYYEVSEAIEPRPALMQGSAYDEAFQEKGADPRSVMHWNQYARCLPFVGKNAGQDVTSAQDLGAARCLEVTRAVLETGFRGLFAWEIFEKGYQSKPDATVPYRYAQAGRLSKQRLFAAIASD